MNVLFGAMVLVGIIAIIVALGGPKDPPNAGSYPVGYGL